MAVYDFSIGGLHGWRGVLFGIVGSLVFLVAGRQDVGPGIGMTSSAFWFLLALASAAGVIWLGVLERVWAGTLLGMAFFFLEVWLVWRWWRPRGKSGPEKGTK